ncbi:MAG: transposase [Bacteroidales bacterium]|nr:transposase [Bacteroidales bacterium]
MNFEKDYIYHIYNQGNNRQKIFFERENYLFFLKKIKTYITPYSDILAWCLMPNHFHLMVLVNEVELDVNSEGFAQSETLAQKRTFNNSIGIMLRSYTNAINKKQKRSGALFRKKTKSECINCPNGITPSFFSINGITKINIQNPEEQYPQVCFNYIHQNPVKANLVNNSVDWEFSSALDYANLRDGKLVNKNVAAKYLPNEQRGLRLKRNPRLKTKT